MNNYNIFPETSCTISIHLFYLLGSFLQWQQLSVLYWTFCLPCLCFFKLFNFFICIHWNHVYQAGSSSIFIVVFAVCNLFIFLYMCTLPFHLIVIIFLLFSLFFWIQILIILIHSTKQLEGILFLYDQLLSVLQAVFFPLYLFTIDICICYNVTSFVLLVVRHCYPDITFANCGWFLNSFSTVSKTSLSLHPSFSVRVGILCYVHFSEVWRNAGAQVGVGVCSLFE